MADETIICISRLLLQAHHPGWQVLAAVNAHLVDPGIKVSTGTFVDAAVTSAPSPSKSRGGVSDSGITRSNVSNEQHFGMKTHVDVDSQHRLLHSVAATTANAHDPIRCPNWCTVLIQPSGATRCLKVSAS
jgi:IS5 family transposase